MRVRFAPSPTGVLHIGGARTALYNWLLARGSGGEFVLRIEDTDRERSTPENVEQILDALRWLELDWDEGPLSQWERRERHSEAVQQLLDSGHAYEDEGAVRFRVPDEGEITFQDAVLGDVTNPYSAIKDFVIQRSDGSPLYNLAVAVDDRDMGITHVVRGQDHVSNTPRQLMLLQALGAEPPVYAHIPLLHGPGREEALEAPRRGVGPGGARPGLPARGGAQLHRAARLGLRREHHLHDDRRAGGALRARARVEEPAVFDEQKLRWMNGRYMRELPPDELQRRLEAFYDRELPREIVEISQREDADPGGLLGSRRTTDRRPASTTTRRGSSGGGRRTCERCATPSPARHVGHGDRGALRASSTSWGEAQGGLPADSGGPDRHDGVARDLRIALGAGSRGVPVKGRKSASQSGIRGRLAPGLNLSSSPADTRGDCGSLALHQAGRGQESAARHNEGHGRRLTAAFEALEAFPALAESRNRVLRVVREDRSSVGEVVQAVESDVALVITVLRIANRTAQRKKGKIASIPEAVEILTPEGVETLAARTATFDFFERTPGWDLMPERFRLHAVATQAAADRLARELEYDDRDQVLCSALLHDVGKLVLTHAYPGYPSQIHGAARTPEERLHKERLELGRGPRARGRRARPALGAAEPARHGDRAPSRRRRRRRGRARPARRHAGPLRARPDREPQAAPPGCARVRAHDRAAPLGHVRAAAGQRTGEAQR